METDNTVRIDGKTLYHIQNLNICTDGTPFDVFLLSDHFPTEQDLKQAWHEEFGHDVALLDEFLTSSEIYEVWAQVI